MELIKLEIDDTRVTGYLHELQEILAEDMPMTILYASRGLKAVNKRIKFGRPKDYGTFISMYKWDIYPEEK